jgi:hypothetical protein
MDSEANMNRMPVTASFITLVAQYLPFRSPSRVSFWRRGGFLSR